MRSLSTGVPGTRDRLLASDWAAYVTGRLILIDGVRAHANQLQAALLGHRGDSRQLFDGGVDPRLGQLDVLELACEVGVVRRHVEVPVP